MHDALGSCSPLRRRFANEDEERRTACAERCSQLFHEIVIVLIASDTAPAEAPTDKPSRRFKKIKLMSVAQKPQLTAPVAVRLIDWWTWNNALVVQVLTNTVVVTSAVLVSTERTNVVFITNAALAKGRL